MRIFFFFLSCFLVACQEQVSTEVLADAPEAELVVAEKIMSPEQRELENKLAARALLQKVVDGSTSFTKQEMMYECTTNTGGLLTIIKNKEELKGIRFATSLEQSSEFMSLYYNNDNLLFIVHEKGEWRGDTELTTQTLFYLDDNEVFRCMRKVASGESSTIEQQINNAEFEEVSIDSRLIERIRTYESLFRSEITQANIATYFCK